jgi:hypothetical protein
MAIADEEDLYRLRKGQMKPPGLSYAEDVAEKYRDPKTFANVTAMKEAPSGVRPFLRKRRPTKR